MTEKTTGTGAAGDAGGAPKEDAPRGLGPAQPREIDRPERETDAIEDRTPAKRG